ncbi:probable E3 ubiquitin-protein ligase ATL44 [Hordeum vulgare subsp. vulgare]|uniref:probable E3 ubiquitin-protein ligase ATL44 n=1 Tax=Hordeum vulgare subsp. vulgare TaxID=112509 RepID=UPI001D1A4172|nr:probable E3 ubiquitin-protein ligase ATL44 [Hordeum vulgare subsp. vulgare]XP_044962142.1 probable E3 ubiquitin-protein ligase ATL44 [Hordeum vulgare subsp. vulgare]
MRSSASLLHRARDVTAGPSKQSPSPSPLPPPLPEHQQPAPAMAVDSDMAVILASLLCALVCILGLALVSRCACRPRRSSSSSSANQSPKGLKKKAIDALPTVSFAAADASPKSSSSSSTAAACSSPLECAICLAEFTDGESVRVLPRCGHNFHVVCVDAWLRTCGTCPSCRAPIVATPAQPLVTPTVVVVVAAANTRCGRCGEVAAPAGGGDSTLLP